MESNKYGWNVTLKFSWGHIVAFVAVVFLSYVAYMGEFYRNGGDFLSAAGKVGLIDLAVLSTFMGAQIAKASDGDMGRSIKIERLLLCLCPLVFVWAMVPYNHFWNVLSERDRLETQFAEAIVESNQMFDDYEGYAEARIRSYESHLRANQYQFGNKGQADMVVSNYVETLRLQLLSQNTEVLISKAKEWIQDADQGASVWNSFLIGNVDVISDAMDVWNRKLVEVSRRTLSNEPGGVLPFDSDHGSLKAATGSLMELKEIYTSSKGLGINTVWTGVILFLMLLFPYCLQDRCTKANGIYGLFKGSPSKGVAPKKARKEVLPSGQSDGGSGGDDLFSGTF